MRPWFFLLVLVCRPALAASPDYDRCVAGIDPAGFANSQRLDCATKEMDRADAALNAAYRDALTRLPARQAGLRQEERGWIDQRRAHCALERQDSNPSRDVNRMSCLIRETDARTAALQAMR